MSERVPVSIDTATYTKPGAHIQYPQLRHLVNPRVQDACNRLIWKTVEAMMKVQGKFQWTHTFEMHGTFEIKTNERDVISLQLRNEVLSSPADYGYTQLKSLTFNLRDGHLYQLNDLFLPHKNHLFTLSKIIHDQIKSRQIPVTKPFRLIDAAQDFYLADKSLIIYFALSQLAPADYGFPMFPISVHELSKSLNPASPLAILARDE